MILYFSGTGNTRRVARKLAEQTRDKACPVTRCARLDGDVLGLVFPIYAWALPKIFERELRRLLPSCKARYIYMVCTCGDDIGRADRRLERLLNKYGCRLNAAVSLQMPETYVALPGFRLDTPEKAKQKIEEAARCLTHTVPRLLRREEFREVVPGRCAWAKSYVLSPLFYYFFVGDKAFHSLDTCNGCGTCVRQCPVGNITLAAGRPHWNGRCTGCLACYHHCPRNAIQLGKRTRGKGRYLFPQPSPFDSKT